MKTLRTCSMIVLLMGLCTACAAEAPSNVAWEKNYDTAGTSRVPNIGPSGGIF